MLLKSCNHPVISSVILSSTDLEPVIACCCCCNYHPCHHICMRWWVHYIMISWLTQASTVLVVLLVHVSPRGICGFSQICWKRLQCQTNLHFLQPWHLTSQDLGCHFYWQPGTGNLASHAKFDISPIHRTWWHGHNIIIHKHPSNYHRETVVFAFKISFKSFFLCIHMHTQLWTCI